MKSTILALVFGLCALTTQVTFAEPNMKEGNVAVWFEIPVVDMTRAIKFYNAILGFDMKENTDGQVPMAFFPFKDKYGAAGALIKMDVMKPGTDGPLVYLNGGDDLQLILDRVVPAGGKIAVGKTAIPNVGHFAVFIDTEGNRLGLFSGQ